MDMEAQRKAAEQLHLVGKDLNLWGEDGDAVKQVYLSVATQITIILQRLGYRKLPKDRPALLRDEEMGQAVLSVAVRDKWCFRGDTLEDNLPSYQAIAQAQWDICIKHYGGKL